MIVKLIACTPNPDKVCAAAAFTSWKKLSTKKLFEELTDKEASDFLGKVIGFGHHSVTEHASFTFSIEGISRACSHELVRHRAASYTQQSQRYVKFKEGEVGWVTPPSVKSVEAKKIFEESISASVHAYNKLLELGIPAEDSRYVLPNAAHTNIVVTMNARSLYNFFNLRLCERAQWEIRSLAEKMLVECKKVAPVLFKNRGPSCVSLGYCPEGSLSCGRQEEMKKKYATD